MVVPSRAYIKVKSTMASSKQVARPLEEVVRNELMICAPPLSAGGEVEACDRCDRCRDSGS